MLQINELPISKSNIKLLAKDSLSELKEHGGYLYATERISAMKEYCDAIREDKDFIEGVRAEIELHGKTTETKNKSKIELAEVGIKYDFSGCNDVEYIELLEKLEKAKQELEVRKDFLKGVPTKGIDVVNEDTGEIIKIYPPVKTSSSSFKVTLCK
jgi:hypothetical protein